MRLAKTCIERPVLAIVINIVVMLLGMLGYSQLQTRFLPNINHPAFHIGTNYPGASAKVVEANITNRLEEHLQTIADVESIESKSYFGSSEIHLKLKNNVDLNKKLEEIRAAVNNAESDFPDDVKPPFINERSTSNIPIMEFGVTDPNMSLADIRDYLERFIRPQLSGVSGVSEVDIEGVGKYAMRIWLDPKLMAARGIAVSDVVNALKNNNIEMPAGEIKSKTMSFPITVDSRLKTASQFNQLLITPDVRLEDIGLAKLGTEESTERIHVNGKPAIDLSIFTSSTASQIAAYKHVNVAMQQIKQQLPTGMQFIPAFNTVDYLQTSLHEVYKTIVLAVLCVLVVVFLFLGNWRAVSIPIVTIPICLIGVFGLLALLGFSINMLTLMALVLAVGLVVDDAIVVLENIYRHLDAGLDKFAAAKQGISEIAYAVLVMTLTLVAVYLPLGFMQGFSATLFRQFAFTLAAAVLISGFVALSLSPMMCAYLLKQQDTNRYSLWLDKVFADLKRRYNKLLDFSLQRRAIIIVVFLLCCVLGFFNMKSLSRELAPKEAMNLVVSFISTPTGSNVEHTMDYSKKIAAILQKAVPDAAVYLWAGFGAEQHAMVNAIVPKTVDSRKLAKDFQKQVDKIPGASVSVSVPSFLNGNSQFDLSFYVQSTESYVAMDKMLKSVTTKLNAYPGLTHAKSKLAFDSQQFVANINRDLAANLGISVKDITDALSVFYGSAHVNDFSFHSNNYKVIAQAKAEYLNSPKKLEEFYLRNSQGQLISVADLVTLKPNTQQWALHHYNGLHAAEIDAQITPGYALGDVVDYLNQHLSEWLPSNAKYTFTGEAKRYLDSNNNMSLIFLLSIVCIYLVLAAQFESFIDPFIILFTVPLSVFGAGGALKLVGGSLNMYTMIGLVTLVGLITKHGILITQFANDLRQTGLSVYQAIKQAATLRLRPILMTTMAMVLGALPLALSEGAGAESRAQLGWTIIGGMLFGTLFSLLLVPIAYSLFKKDKA